MSINHIFEALDRYQLTGNVEDFVRAPFSSSAVSAFSLRVKSEVVMHQRMQRIIDAESLHLYTKERLEKVLKAIYLLSSQHAGDAKIFAAAQKIEATISAKIRTKKKRSVLQIQYNQEMNAMNKKISGEDSCLYDL